MSNQEQFSYSLDDDDLDCHCNEDEEFTYDFIEGEKFIYDFNDSEVDFFAYAEENAGDGSENVALIPDFNRTYTLTLSNNNATPRKITIFGANQNITENNFGLPFNVTAEVGESSYRELLSETQTSPFIISGFRVTSSDISQLDQILQVKKKDGNGQIGIYSLQLQSYLSISQYQNVREVAPYNITFAGTTQISLSILPNSTLVFSFFVGKRVQEENALHNEPTIAVSTNSLPFLGKERLDLSEETIAALKNT